MNIKERIITGANKLYIKHGVRRVTMNMIAERLGVSKRTIYEQFNDKNELLRHCIDRVIQDQRQIQKEVQNNTENVIEATFYFIRYSLKHLNEVNPNFFFDIEKYYPKLWEEKIKENEIVELNQSMDFLNEGIEQGLFRKQINVKIIAKLFPQLFKMICDEELFPEDRFLKADLFENIIANYLRGIATEEGVLLINKYRG